MVARLYISIKKTPSFDLTEKISFNFIVLVINGQSFKVTHKLKKLPALVL